MTTSPRPTRFTSGLNASKVLAFLQGGGKAKLGKAMNDHHIEFGGDLEKAPGEYVVAVQREGVCQAYWYATALDTLKEHGSVVINGTTVSLK